MLNQCRLLHHHLNNLLFKRSNQFKQLLLHQSSLWLRTLNQSKQLLQKRKKNRNLHLRLLELFKM
jgi:hypothetical protein